MISKLERMAEAYRYLYFRIYRWQLAQFGYSNAPEFVAASGVAWLICFNLLTALLVCRSVLGVDVLQIGRTPLVVTGISVILQAIVISMYVLGGRYKAIVAAYERETVEEKRRRGIYVWTYALMSVGLLICAFWMLAVWH